jgi:hypothetical protein
MPDTMPDHADLEKYVKELPKSIVSRLPDNIARRRAEALIDQAYEYAKESRERKADR